MGPRARVMYGAVLDSEGSRINLGECTIVSENAVLRATAAGDTDHPVLVGDHVFVSPHATLLGCTIEPCSYVATGATLLQGATVHSGAVGKQHRIIRNGAFEHAPCDNDFVGGQHPKMARQPHALTAEDVLCET